MQVDKVKKVDLLTLFRGYRTKQGLKEAKRRRHAITSRRLS